MNPQWPRANAPWFPIVAFAQLSIVATFSAPPAVAQSVENVHVTSAGEQANWYTGYASSISEDNRWVAFDSDATNLVPGDTNGERDCFVHDRTTGATILISATTSGGVGNGSSIGPALSASGRYVAFFGRATDLVAGGATAVVSVYRRDRDTDADGIFDEPGATLTILVSVSSAGVEGNSYSRGAFISDDGDRIAFESEATNLVAGDTNGSQDGFVRTVSTATTIRVSVTSAGGQPNGGCGVAGLSGNGNIVSITSGSPLPDNIVPGDTNGTGDVFVRNIALGTTTRVSVSTGGVQGDGYSGGGSLSDDGTLVVFQSAASNLVPDDTNGFLDIFVRNLATSTTTRGSQSVGGGDPDWHCTGPSISGDGLFIAFESPSSNVVPGDAPGVGDGDIVVRNLSTGVNALASRAADGAIGNMRSAAPYLSEDGSFVSFGSDATNLLAGADTNDVADLFVRVAPFDGPGPYSDPGPGPGGDSDTCFCACGQNYDSTDVDVNPVTFSVNGPVDPHTEGIGYARGTPAPPPAIPGDALAFGVRFGPVPQADGIDALVTPGDVFDYDAAAVPSEAVMFESTPLPPPDGSAPDGTNNQVLQAMAMGLAGGPATPMGLWTSYFPPRDNIDGFSFGEDYFPDSIITGLDVMAGLPVPPFDPATGEVMPAFTPWAGRASLYSEPIVTGDAPGISFRTSVDPWAIGLPATSVLFESGGFDVGAGLGPWTSPGDAAGDVFGTPILMRVGGVTVGGGTNSLVWNNPALALAPLLPPLDPMEDDVDALECVGENDSTWMMPGGSDRPGNLHARVEHVAGSGLPPPDSSWHDPVNTRPVFFSVTRNSPGAPFTGVRSQFVLDGGAAADIFAAVKDPMDPAGVGLNLLFIDEAELGLYAVDASPIGAGMMDYTDDLDALILCVCDEYRPTIVMAIEEILGIAPPFTPGGLMPWTGAPGSSLKGGGMDVSITKYLEATGRPIPEDCIHVGFSVTTDAIGLEYTGVDYEAGPVFPVAGVSAAAGDVFFAEVDGDPANTNSLWYEEMDLGLDAGTWMNGASMSLDELSDNLNALDAIGYPPDTTVMVDPLTGVEEIESSGRRAPLDLGPNFPNPFNPSTTMAYTVPRESRVTLAIFDIQGRRVATLVDEVQAAGRHVASWNGESDDGSHAPSGVYFARLVSGGESKTGKIMLVK